ADNAGTAMTVGGEGTRVDDNLITGNGGAGIVMSSAGVTISRNSIHDNGKAGIDIAVPGEGRGAAGAGGARGGPGGRGPGAAGGRGPGAPGMPPRVPSRPVTEIPAPPVLTPNSSWTAGGMTLNGTVAGKPDQSYRIEIFASRPAGQNP